MSEAETTSSEHPLARLWHHARGHRGKIIAASGFSVLNKLFDLAPPALIGAAVDIVVEREESLFAQLGFKDPTEQLIALAVVTVIVWVLESLFEYLLERTWRNLAQTIQHELRVEAYGHIQDLEMAYFHDQSTGSLMSILNDDINQLERFLDQGANDIIQVLTTAILVSGAFFYLAPSVAWMAMLPVPFILFGSFRFQSMLTERYADVRAKVGDLNGQLANNLTGIATIKSFTTEEYEAERIARVSDAYRQSNYSAIVLSAAFSPLIRMFIVVGFTATLIWGGKLALAGELPVGTYSVLVFLTQRLLWPLTRLGRTFDLYQRAMASTQRVLNLLRTPITIASGEQKLAREDIKGAIRFHDVTFSYPDREPILRNFDLEIPAGATIGLVGSTGSGKTTLINLLLRFYQPQGGKITLDGQALEDLDMKDLRGAIGLVSQHTFLFHGTVEENVAYGTFSAKRERVLDVIDSAEATEFVEDLPAGVETVVGERGETLSGGQRQRLSIARALLKDPPVLILDEATSAVDNETEAALQRSLDSISADRTTIVIAHRLSTVRNADMIVVLDGGRIAERGKHEELLEKNGIYARLWSVQTGDTDHRDQDRAG
ncbi:MAG: ABC transporter ATP-binding protein [Myxococcota bacterium]|nr:ABC transporter ATP-binding protein [Myxococcota bacterium]